MNNFKCLNLNLNGEKTLLNNKLKFLSQNYKHKINISLKFLN